MAEPESALPEELPICRHCNTPLYSVFHVRCCPRRVHNIAAIIDPSRSLSKPVRDKAKAILNWMADNG